MEMNPSDHMAAMSRIHHQSLFNESVARVNIVATLLIKGRARLVHTPTGNSRGRSIKKPSRLFDWTSSSS